MVDKEAAVEYVKKIECCEEIYNDLRGEKEPLYDEEQITQAYLDGLNAGREDAARVMRQKLYDVKVKYDRLFNQLLDEYKKAKCSD